MKRVTGRKKTLTIIEKKQVKKERRVTGRKKTGIISEKKYSKRKIQKEEENITYFLFLETGSMQCSYILGNPSATVYCIMYMYIVQ